MAQTAWKMGFTEGYAAGDAGANVKEALALYICGTADGVREVAVAAGVRAVKDHAGKSVCFLQFIQQHRQHTAAGGRDAALYQSPQVFRAAEIRLWKNPACN